MYAIFHRRADTQKKCIYCTLHTVKNQADPQSALFSACVVNKSQKMRKKYRNLYSLCTVYRYTIHKMCVHRRIYSNCLPELHKKKIPTTATLGNVWSCAHKRSLLSGAYCCCYCRKRKHNYYFGFLYCYIQIHV